MIGPAEIEDILSDLSDALIRARGAPLERTLAWPVPAGTLGSAHHETGSSSASQPHDALSAGERRPDLNTAA